MLELKEYQENAVNELMSKIKKQLNLNVRRKKIILKAPTGSGKTVIASALLEQLTEEMPEWYDSMVREVAFIWIAPNKLHEQSYFKMKNFFSTKKLLNTMRWDELDHTLDYLKHGDILFLNWESINKDNALIMRESESHRTLIEIARRTQTEHHTPIIVIIDEEHMFAGRNAKKAQQVLEQINPKIELRISATPITPSDEIVKVYREDVIKEEMIKKYVNLNPAVKGDPTSGLTMNQQLLRDALRQRDALAQKYEKIGKNINPLLLIQLPNDTKEKADEEERQIIDEVKTYLNLHEINTDRRNLAVWLSNEKENLEGIEKLDCPVKALLFKQAIALGWDCPRAAVLLIFRELHSITFTVQTVGRILRMPEQRFYSDEALNKGYVYTNLSRDMIEIVRDDMNYMSKYVATRKENVENVTLTSQSPHSLIVHNRLGYDFRPLLKRTFQQQWALNDLHIFHNYFEASPLSPPKEGEKEAPPKDAEDIEEEQHNQAIHNRKQAGLHNIDFDIRSIVTIIPKDMIISDEEGKYKAQQTERMARTQGEVDAMFWLFCRNHVGSFAKKDSTPVLYGALMAVMEDYFQVFETDAKKIILYPGNQNQFVQVIDVALTAYQTKKELEAKKAQTTIDEFDWHIPDTRTYNEDTHIMAKAPMHAMQPFFAFKRESTPEQQFRLFLEKHDDDIDWWYKNGDSGRENFSVAYEGIGGKQKAFYVDFIIRMKDGTICLFDTKTKGSDPEGKNKHNALYNWMKKESERRHMKLVGGILIGENDFQTWKYSPIKVENITDTGGWNVFNPKEYGL